jgi:hypothetical protein
VMSGWGAYGSVEIHSKVSSVRSKRLAWCVRYYPTWGYENSLREAVK